MAEDTNRINMEIGGLEKVISLLKDYVDVQNKVAEATQKSIADINIYSAAIEKMAAGTIKQIAGSFLELATYLDGLNAILEKKGLKQFFDGKGISSLATILSTLTTATSGLKLSTDAAAFVDFLTKFSRAISTKAFSASTPNLTQLGAALKAFSKSATGLKVSATLAKNITALITAVTKTGINTAGATLRALGTALVDFDKSLKQTTFIGNEIFVANLARFSDALNKFALVFNKFKDSTKTSDIVANFNKLMYAVEALFAQFAGLQINNVLTMQLTQFSVALAALSKAFRSFTVGKNLANLEANSNALISFIEKLNALDIETISARLIPLANAIKGLAEAGRLVTTLNKVAVEVAAIKKSASGGNPFTSFFKGLYNVAVIINKLPAQIKVVVQAFKNIVSGIGHVLGWLGKFILLLIKSFEVITRVSIALVAMPFKIVYNAIKSVVMVIGGFISTITKLIGAVLSVINVFGLFKRAFDSSKTALKNYSDSTKSATGATQTFESAFAAYEHSANKVAVTQDKVASNTNDLSNEFVDGANKAQLYGTSFNSVGDSSDNLSQHFTKLFFTVKTFETSKQIITQFARSAITAFKGIVTSALGAIAEVESMSASIQVFQARELVQTGQFDTVNAGLAEGKKRADELIKSFKILGAKSPFDATEIANSFKQLQVFGFMTEDAKILTKILVDFAAGAGKQSSDISEIALVFGQIRSAGQLLGQDLKQLLTKGIPVGEALAATFKELTGEVLTSDEAIAKAQAGFLSVDDIIVSIAKNLNTDFGGSAERMANTVSGLISTFGELKKSTLVDIFAPVAESLKPFVILALEFTETQQFTDIINGISTSISGFLVPALKTVISYFIAFKNAWDNLSEPVQAGIIAVGKFTVALVAITVLATAVATALTLLVTGFGLIINPVTLVVGAIVGLAALFVTLRTQISAFSTSAIAALGQFLTKAVTVISTVASRLYSLIPSFSTVATALSSIVGKVASYGANIVQQLANGIITSVNAIVNAIKYVGSIISYWLKPGSPPRILPDIDKWGEDTATVYLEGFKKADFSNISEFGKTLADQLAAINITGIDTTSITNVFAKAISNIDSGIDIDLSSVFEDIARVAPNATTEVNTLVEKYLKLAQATKVAEDATSKYDAAIGALEGTISSIEDIGAISLENKQISRLENFASSQFATEQQRQAALQEAERIRATQKLRSLKLEQEQANNSVDAAKDEVDLIKARLDLANEFAPQATIIPDDIIPASDGTAAKLAKDLEDATGVGKDLAETISGIGSSLSDIDFGVGVSSIVDGLGELDLEAVDLGFGGITDRLGILGDKIAEIQTKLSAFFTKLTTKFDELKLRISTFTSSFLTGFTAPNNSNILDAILGFDVNNIQGSLGKITGAVKTTFDKVIATITNKKDEIVAELEKGSSLEDAVSKAFTGNTFATSIDKFSTFIRNAFDEGYSKSYSTNAELDLVSKIAAGIQSLANAILDTKVVSDAIDSFRTTMSKAFDTLRTIPVVGVITSIYEVAFEALQLLARLLLGTSITSAIDTFLLNTTEAFDRLKTIPGFGVVIDKLQGSIEQFNNFLKIQRGEIGLPEFLKTLIPDNLIADGTIDRLSTIVKDLFNNFNIFANSQTVQSLIPFFRELAKVLGTVLVVAAAAITVALAALLPSLDGILSDILDIGTAILTFINDTVMAIVSLVIGQASFIDTIKTIGMSLFTNIMAIFDNIDSIAAHIVDFIPNILGFISSLTGINFDSIINTYDKIRPVLEFLVSTVLLSGLGKLVGWLGKVFGESRLVAAFSSAFAKLGSAWTKIVSIAETVGVAIVNFLSKFTPFRVLFSSIGTIFNALRVNINAFWQELLLITPTGIITIIQSLITKFTAFGTLLSGISFTAILQGINILRTGLEPLLTILTPIGTAIGTFFTNITTKVSEFGTDILAKIKTAFSNIGPAIANLFSSTGDDLTSAGAGSGAGATVPGGLSLLPTLISALLPKITSSVTGLFTGLKDTAVAKIAEISPLITEKLGGIFSSITTVLSTVTSNVLKMIFGTDDISVIGTAISTFLTDAIDNGFATLTTALSTISATAIDLIKLVFGDDETTTSGKIGKFLTNVVTDGFGLLTSALTTIKTISLKIVDVLFGTNRPTTLTELTDFVSGILADGLAFIGTSLTTLGSTALNIIELVFGTTDSMTIGAKIGEFLKTSITLALGALVVVGLSIIDLLFGTTDETTESTALGDFLKKVWDGSITVLKNLGNLSLGIVEGLFGTTDITAISDTLLTFLKDVVGLALTGLSAFYEIAGDAIINLVGLIFGDDAATTASNFITPITETITGFIDTIQEKLSTVSIADIFAGIREFIDGIEERVVLIETNFNRIKTFFTDFKLPNIFEVFEIPESVKKILEFAGIDVGTKIKESAETEIAKLTIPAPNYVESDFTEIGANAGDTIATGVAKGMEDEVQSSGFWSNFTNFLTGGGKNAIESNSPSELAAREFGEPLAQGILLGLERGLTTELITGIFTALVAKINTALTGATGGGFTVVFTATMQMFYTELTSQLNSFSTNYSEASIEFYEKLIEYLDTYIEDNTDNTIEFYDNYIDLLIKFSDNTIALYENLYTIVKNITKLFIDAMLLTFTNFATSLSNIFIKMRNDIVVIVNDMFAQILTATEAFKAAFIDIAQKAVDGFIEELKKLASRAINTITDALNKIKEQFDGENELAFKVGVIIGESIGDGVSRGIENKIKYILATVERMIDQAMDAAKGALEASSPSRRAARELGEPIGDGVEVGIIKSFKSASKTLGKKLEELTSGDGFDTTLPTISPSGIGTLANAASNTNQSNNNSGAAAQRVASTTSSTVVNNTYVKNYNMNLTVTPERATQVTKNFNVAEFLGV